MAISGRPGRPWGRSALVAPLASIMAWGYLLLRLADAGSPPSPPTPLNAAPYTIANPMPGARGARTRRHRGEYFEVLGPEETTRYSEVYWKSQPVELPWEIRARFNHSVMAVTGMEVDIVRTIRHANQTATTESASCKELYNHHYSGWMYGRLANMEEPQRGSDDNPFLPSATGTHGKPLPRFRLPPRIARGDNTHYPNVQAFSEGNGNEHRGSFKGYARGHAQLIYAPTTWANNPMIINTNKKLTHTDPKDDPGPIDHTLVPRHSLAPRDSTYSGIIECPCTTRKIKILDGYRVLTESNSKCRSNTAVATPAECRRAAVAAGLSPLVRRKDGYIDIVDSKSSSPSGCSAEYDENKRGWALLFNKALESERSCGSGSRASIGGAAGVSVGVGSISVVLSKPSNTATITFRVPSNHTWFGFGFNASSMADTPYAIIVNGSGHVEERRLGNHASGSALAVQSLTVVSATTNATDGMRIIVVKRPLLGSTALHYSPRRTRSNHCHPSLRTHRLSDPSYHGEHRESLLLHFSDVG